ncbi:ATP-binding cassette domain-containing protein [soil metagenome]
MYCLETNGLIHKYSEQETVLKGINLQVPLGSIYGFLGPNGAGKTTTLRLVLGLLRKQQGTISIFGKSLDSSRIEILQNIGSLIECPSLYDHLSASENLRLLQVVYQCPRRRIEEVLELVGLAKTGTKRVGRFSLGMKQRLSIAVALLHAPQLLILDEPTNGLDPNGMIEMRDLLGKLNRENGVTILISSHLLSEIDKLVTDVGIISKGRLVFQGPMDALKKKQQRVTSAFLCTNDDEKALEYVVEKTSTARLCNGRIVLPALSNPEIAQLNRQLIERGLDVHEIGAVRNDLESIFLELIGS